MASNKDFVVYVCDQLRGAGNIRYRKMFGDYMIYVDERPAVLLCDNVAYVKMLPCIAEELADTDVGIPYPGAKPHYILDVDDGELACRVAAAVATMTPLPRKKR